MNRHSKWKMIAVPTAWMLAGIVTLSAGNPFPLMVALLATAMLFFIEDAKAPR